MKKTLVLLVGMLFATICGTATSQQYYNISPKWIYEHQTMDSTHVTWILVGNGTAALPSIAGINDPNTGMRFPGVDTLAFSTGGSERMRIDPSGNVGIGTTGPVSKLDVRGTLRVSDASNVVQAYMRGNEAGSAVEVGANSAHPLYLIAGAQIGATLTSTGNVGIGTTSFGTSAAGWLGIKTGTAPSTIPADVLQIGSSDVSAGNAVLSWWQEYAPYAGVGVASTTKIPVIVNGTTLYILATTVQ